MLCEMLSALSMVIWIPVVLTTTDREADPFDLTWSTARGHSSTTLVCTAGQLFSYHFHMDLRKVGSTRVDVLPFHMAANHCIRVASCSAKRWRIWSGSTVLSFFSLSCGCEEGVRHVGAYV